MRELTEWIEIPYLRNQTSYMCSLNYPGKHNFDTFILRHSAQGSAGLGVVGPPEAGEEQKNFKTCVRSTPDFPCGAPIPSEFPSSMVAGAFVRQM